MQRQKKEKKLAMGKAIKAPALGAKIKTKVALGKLPTTIKRRSGATRKA